MGCAEYREQLSSYADGALEAERRTALESHLQQCRACQADLASLRQMLEALHALPHPASPDLAPGVHQRLQQLRHRPSLALPALILPWRGLALAASAALVALVVVLPAYRVRQRARSSDDSSFQLAQRQSQASQYFYGGDRGGAPSGKKSMMKAEEVEKPMHLASTRRGIELEGVNRSRLAGSLVFQGQQTLGGIGTGAGPAASIADMAVPPEKEAADRVGSEGGLMYYGSSPETKEANMPAGAVATGRAGAPAFLQVRWEVPSISETSAKIIEWVTAHQGSVVVANEHQLSITLPTAQLHGFLQQFSPARDAAQEMVDQQTPWVTISLELVSPSQ